MRPSGLFHGALFGILSARLVNEGDWPSACLLGAGFLHQLWLWQKDWRRESTQKTAIEGTP